MESFRSKLVEAWTGEDCFNWAVEESQKVGLNPSSASLNQLRNWTGRDLLNLSMEQFDDCIDGHDGVRFYILFRNYISNINADRVLDPLPQCEFFLQSLDRAGNKTDSEQNSSNSSSKQDWLSMILGQGEYSTGNDSANLPSQNHELQRQNDNFSDFSSCFSDDAALLARPSSEYNETLYQNDVSVDNSSKFSADESFSAPNPPEYNAFQNQNGFSAIHSRSFLSNKALYAQSSSEYNEFQYQTDLATHSSSFSNDETLSSQPYYEYVEFQHSNDIPNNYSRSFSMEKVISSQLPSEYNGFQHSNDLSDNYSSSYATDESLFSRASSECHEYQTQNLLSDMSSSSFSINESTDVHTTYKNNHKLNNGPQTGGSLLVRSPFGKKNQQISADFSPNYIHSPSTSEQVSDVALSEYADIQWSNNFPASDLNSGFSLCKPSSLDRMSITEPKASTNQARTLWKMGTKETRSPNRPNRVRGFVCWEYLLEIIQDPTYNPSHIQWENKAEGTFRIMRSKKEEVARNWGLRKDCKPKKILTYDNFARSLRYHYGNGHLDMVSEKNHVYKFGPEAMKLLGKEP